MMVSFFDLATSPADFSSMAVLSVLGLAFAFFVA